MTIKIYNRERELGLAEKIAFETKSSIIEEMEIREKFKDIDFAESTKFYKYEGDKEWEMQNMSDDLFGFNAILVSTVWNENDDVFSKEETWKARDTPIYKSVNIGHKGREGVGNDVVGVIISSMCVDDELEYCYSPTNETPPDKFKHIIVSMRVWERYFPTHTKYIKDGIDAKKLFVSMECIFNDFGYALKEESKDEVLFLPRNEITAWLTQHLRIYGGSGQVQINGKNYKVGRWLKDIIFSGVGVVTNPANPDSFIFSDYLSVANVQEFSENISKNTKKSVFLNKGEFLLWS